MRPLVELMWLRSVLLSVLQCFDTVASTRGWAVCENCSTCMQRFCVGTVSNWPTHVLLENVNGLTVAE